MKRLLSLLLSLLLLCPLFDAEAKTGAYPAEIHSNVGRSYVFAPSSRGVWSSSDEAVAQVNGRGIINFLAQGQAVVTFVSGSGKESALKVTVGPAGDMPALIRQGIDFALAEWEAAGGASFPRSNKYTFWLRNAKSSFGWCGAFANYALESAGVPAKLRGQSDLLTDGRAHAVHEAAVPKIWEAFTKMDRVAYIPQPGYEVIYGRRGGTPYIHLGLVTDVTPLGGGLYDVKTVEGNMDNRILRYHYIYDANAGNREKNYMEIPSAQRAQPDIFKYELHNKGAWYITAFGQTWY